MEAHSPKAHVAEASPSEDRQFFYRFRTIDALLGKERSELVRQHIFLAAPEQLNDPMEGYREVLWDGDEILWRNLIRNYVLCLISAVAESLIRGSEHWERPRIDPMSGFDGLPTDAYRELAQSISSRVLSDADVKGMASRLGSLGTPLTRDAVTSCLSIIHPRALNFVLTELAERGLAPNISLEFERLPGAEEFLRLLAEVDKREEVPLHAFFETMQQLQQQLGLIARYNYRDRAVIPMSYLVLDFPEDYVAAAVDALVHPPWYTTCFVGDCSNASMWGTYGDGHKGVALKFEGYRIGGGAPGLDLFRGVDSPRDGDRPDMTVPFLPVTYSAPAPRVDFFRSLGRIPPRKIQREWAADEELGTSSALRHIGGDEWRARYWERMQESMTQKLPDWAHEREYRLARPDALGSLSEPESRIFTYKFSSLAGIVFGMRTTASDRVAIMAVVERKCREEGRAEFEFSEARYSSREGRIEIVPLRLLQFAKGE